jgi:DNA-binding NtrC family response regulator
MSKPRENLEFMLPIFQEDKMRSEPTVLFVSGDPAATLDFEKVLSKHLILKRVQDLSQLHAVLANTDDYDAVLCGGSFRKGDWQEAMRFVLHGNPHFPLIISRRIGTEREWVEVLGAGAFDLLPVSRGEHSVLSLLEDAVAIYEARQWKNGLQQLLSCDQTNAGELLGRASI